MKSHPKKSSLLVNIQAVKLLKVDAQVPATVAFLQKKLAHIGIPIIAVTFQKISNPCTTPEIPNATIMPNTTTITEAILPVLNVKVLETPDFDSL